MPKKRGRSVVGRRKATKPGTASPGRRAARVSSDVWIPPKEATRKKMAREIDKAMERPVELWTPPPRKAKPKPTGARFSARSLLVDHPAIPTEDLFIPSPHSKNLTARELGFTAKGVCLYGCDGCRSLKFPNIAMHHYTCAFWATVDGQDKTPF